MAKQERSYFNNLRDRNNNLKLFPGTHQIMIDSEKSIWNTVRETKRYAGHTEKVSGLNELKNLATREKLEVWGINLTLGICQIAVCLWNSGNVVGQEN